MFMYFISVNNILLLLQNRSVENLYISCDSNMFGIMLNVKIYDL